MKRLFLVISVLTAGWVRAAGPAAAPASAEALPLWKLAQQQRSVHRISTLFTAPDVRRHHSGEHGLEGAIDWLGNTEKTYVEQARQTVLAGAGESLLFEEQVRGRKP